MTARLKIFIDELNSSLSFNYELIATTFNSEYGYPELDPLRDEICKCIICNLHQAAITLTNHLLESSLKKCLSMKHSISNKQNDIKLEDAFKEGITKFDQLDLDDTINRACTQGLITKKQKKLLKKLKNEFRNPYSHATTSEIFKDTTVKGKTISFKKEKIPKNLLKHIFDDDSDKIIAVKDILPIQGLVQVVIAKQKSVPYFTDVDKIIRDMLTKLKPNGLTPYSLDRIFKTV